MVHDWRDLLNLNRFKCFYLLVCQCVCERVAEGWTPIQCLCVCVVEHILRYHGTCLFLSIPCQTKWQQILFTH